MKPDNVVSIWSKRARGCSVAGCRHGHHALGLCRGHYDRLRRTGQVSPDRPLGRPLRRLELCGCAVPQTGRSGVVCARCGRGNLVAMLDGHESYVMPAALASALAHPAQGLEITMI